MKSEEIIIIEELVNIRSLLRGAVAATEALARSLEFSQVDTDGWPVLRLRASTTEANIETPNLKISASNGCEIIIRSSLSEKPETIDFSQPEASQQLKQSIASQISSMIDWTHALDRSNSSDSQDEVPEELEFISS